MDNTIYDYVIVGSGFGGSVSAHRLTEKGYSVLVVEKGRRFAKEDFPKNNWHLRSWMWRPSAGLQGIFQMSFFKHVTVLHGVGVGGGSLTYANTLPMPTDSFFNAPSWSGLGEWKKELAPHYATAKRMLGAATCAANTPGDKILKQIAADMGRSEHVHPTDVAVYFGTPGKKVPDPYFGGEGPDRVGCTMCGACMTGCRVGAKNTLDQNYLYLAEKRGAKVLPETEVTSVRSDGANGYVLETKESLAMFPKKGTLRGKRVIFAGGVMGTVPLLLQMREDPNGLPNLSARVGEAIRTNSEAIIAVVAPDTKEDFSKGVAITSIVNTDEHSHVEPVRYGEGSSFFRLLAMPHAPGTTLGARIRGVFRAFARSPWRTLRAFFTLDHTRKTMMLLYMRTLDGTLRIRLSRGIWTGFRRGMTTELDDSNVAPAAFMTEATELAERFAEKVKGVCVTLLTETLLGVPSTAHILGGACMGSSAADGVIDTQHRVFGYEGLYVIDGSAVSANPGVNPSLTITALAERAMSFIPPKSA